MKETEAFDDLFKEIGAIATILESISHDIVELREELATDPLQRTKMDGDAATLSLVAHRLDALADLGDTLVKKKPEAA